MVARELPPQEPEAWIKRQAGINWAADIAAKHKMKVVGRGFDAVVKPNPKVMTWIILMSELSLGLGLTLGFLTPVAAFASIALNLLYFVLMIHDWAEQGQNAMMVLAAVVILGPPRVAGVVARPPIGMFWLQSARGPDGRGSGPRQTGFRARSTLEPERRSSGMPIGIGEDHEELRRTVRRWVETRCPPGGAPGPARRRDRDAAAVLGRAGRPGLAGHPRGRGVRRPGLRPARAGRGGRGAGPGGRPGAGAPHHAGRRGAGRASDPADGKELLPPSVDGSLPAVVALPGSGALSAAPGPTASVTLNGHGPPRAGRRRRGPAPARAGDPEAGDPGDEPFWCALDLDAPGVAVEPAGQPGPDPAGGRRGGDRRRGRPRAPAAGGDDRPACGERALAMAAAECAGGARWCLETATAATPRTGASSAGPSASSRPIKHRLADMLVSVEQVTALAWDAARAADGGDADQAGLAAVLAGALALDAYVEAAKGCIQILGGMGFTWEHDAHLHLRRALSLRQLLGGSAALRAEASRAGAGRRPAACSPPSSRADAEALRGEIRAVVAEVAAARRRPRSARLIVEHGLLAPHWPVPVRTRAPDPSSSWSSTRRWPPPGCIRPSIAVGAWALPTIIAHGTARAAGAVRRSHARGASSGGASSSASRARAATWPRCPCGPRGTTAASCSTARRCGRRWPSKADWGICLARTDPEAPKHEGITYFLVDMQQRRASRSGRCARSPAAAMFNEVFFTDVFVPDDCVVGAVNGGWRLARTTLANERVSMSSGATFGFGIEGMLGVARQRAAGPTTPSSSTRSAALLAEAQSLALLGARTTLRSVSGVEPGPEASVRKLLGAEHEQRVQELGLVLLGAEGASTEGDAGPSGARGFCPPAA